jgi:hypothetical protein
MMRLEGVVETKGFKIMTDSRALAESMKAKLEAVCASLKAPAKHVFVGIESGAITITFYSEVAANKAANALAVSLRIKAIIASEDLGVSTSVNNGIRDKVSVWRLHAALAA